MDNLLNTGLQWLEQKLNSFCSSPVEYRKEGLSENAQTVNAMFGKTDIQIGHTDNFQVQSFVWDFLIPAGALEFLPDSGDTILVNGIVYEVMNLAGQGCWQYTSPTRQTYRVHTREI